MAKLLLKAVKVRNWIEAGIVRLEIEVIRWKYRRENLRVARRAERSAGRGP